MDTIENIVGWAKGQPIWQQKLVAELLSGKIADDALVQKYFGEALEFARDHDGYSKSVGEPLEKYSYSKDESVDGVRITEIQATQNINAIADGTKLPIEKNGLNIIYGNNASGKSGYTRILKCNCNCRHSESVKGNVDGDHTKECIAHISYEVDGDTNTHEFNGESIPNKDLLTVHVFDSKSGHNYLVAENDITYMPAGMDVLDSLSSSLDRINGLLKKELEAKNNSLNDLAISFSEFTGTKAHELIGGLSDEGATDKLNVLKVLTLDEQQEVIKLKKDIVLRQSKSPQKVREEKQNLYTKLNTLLLKSRSLAESLAIENVEKIVSQRDSAIGLRKVAEEGGKTRFENENHVDGTGDSLWKILWDSAKEFSEKSAYPAHPFPYIQEGAKCVLCQQDLTPEGSERFAEFVKYVEDKSQLTAQTAERAFKEMRDNFVRSNLLDEYFTNITLSVSDDDYENISTLYAQIGVARGYHAEYLDIFNSNKKLIDIKDVAKLNAELLKLEEVVKKLEVEIKKPLDDDEFRRKLQEDTARLKELESKQKLNTYEKSILENIAIHKEMGVIKAAIATSNTYAVSSKIGDISEKVIIENLADTFNTELNSIFSGKITARLAKGRTTKGVPSSAIVLSGKSGDFKGDNLEKIMSEGEQRGVALAGFFAELSLSPSKSAIVLDDPVTSLDHLNIEKIAKRIAEESLTRQVIVFTHNVLFASELERSVKELEGGTHVARSIEKVATPGVVRETLPFDTIKTGQRIDFLEKKVNPLKAMFEANDEEYKSAAESFYKDLRRTWERAIEEKLLNNTVIRYRRDVKPGNVLGVTVTDDDKKLISDNMEICAKFVHDPADETGGVETPTPDDLKKDLDTVKKWVTDLKERNK